MKTSLLKISLLPLSTLSLLLLTFSVQAATVLDTFIDGEAGTDGTVVTTDIATSATHGVTGSWSTVPSGGLSQLFISTAKISSLRGPVKVGDTTYDGSGSTRSFRMHNTVSAQHFAKYSFTTTKGRVSVGFAMYLSSAGAGWGNSFNFFDLFGMNGVGGDFITLSHDDKPTLEWRAHTQAGLSAEVFNPIQDKWYWVTVLWDRPGLLGTIKVYDMDTWVRVGHMEAVLQDQDCNYVSIGRYDAHSSSNIDADYYVDNFMIDFTTGVFPLLPGGPLEVDTYVDMETGSNGELVTKPTAANATHPACDPCFTHPACDGCWTTRRMTQTQPDMWCEDVGCLTQMFLSSPTEYSPLRDPVLAGGTLYQGASAQSWRMHADNGFGPGNWLPQYAKYTLPSGTRKLSIALAMKWSGAGAGWGRDSNFYDLLAIEGINGEFLVLNGQSWRPAGGDLVVRAHTQTELDHGHGKGLSQSACNVFMDQWYWVTMLWDEDDKGYIRIFNMTTWAELPGSPLSLEWGSASNARFIAVGRYDNHGSQLNADYYNDNLIIDYSNASFPLLP